MQSIAGEHNTDYRGIEMFMYITVMLYTGFGVVLYEVTVKNVFMRVFVYYRILIMSVTFLLHQCYFSVILALHWRYIETK